MVSGQHYKNMSIPHLIQLHRYNHQIDTNISHRRNHRKKKITAKIYQWTEAKQKHSDAIYLASAIVASFRHNNKNRCGRLLPNNEGKARSGILLRRSEYTEKKHTHTHAPASTWKIWPQAAARCSRADRRPNCPVQTCRENGCLGG